VKKRCDKYSSFERSIYLISLRNLGLKRSSLSNCNTGIICTGVSGAPGRIQDLWGIERSVLNWLRRTFERYHAELFRRSRHIPQKWQQLIIPCRSCGKLGQQGDESCQRLNRRTWLAGTTEVNDAPCIFLAHLPQNAARTGEGDGRDDGSFGGKQERGTNGRRVANFRSVDASCNEVRY